jgi:hypothetical protein
MVEMLNQINTKAGEYQIETMFPGDSCFPMSPANEDLEIEGDDLNQFRFA